MSLKGVEIENLGEFRRALRRAQDGAPRQLSAAIRRAGRPLLERAAEVAPRGPSGKLKRSYRLRVSGTSGRVFSAVPYGAGAEWGLHGKWKGFRRYPAFGTGAARGRGRFAWRAVVERKEEIVAVISEELRQIITIQGWAKET
ncbi:MAG TPA: hypothetical protein VNO79_08775 [Actinomycetota bacterium]|nr:hypothetical protein [Actinomycetota bacterium]